MAREPLLSELGSDSRAIGFLHLRDLVLNGVTIQTDVPKVQIDAQMDNPYFRHLVKNLRINANPQAFAEMRSNEQAFFARQPQSLYFLSATYSGEKLSQLCRQTGFYCFGPKPEAGRMFQDRVQDLVGRDKTTWQFLEELLQPHNAMVIADPYLFTENAVEACMKMVDSVVPRQQKCPYYLTLIGRSRGGSLNEIPLSMIKSRVDKIRQAVTRILPHAVVEFHTANRPDFHDRLIITNNVMIYSGSGLDAIGRNGEATKDSYWVAVSPYKRLSHNGVEGTFGYKAIKNKLERFNNWIKQSELAQTSNPLFA
ncbi:hypothetical protein BUE76_01460 [Cnuella takakiae]|nr:hypothetical protein BUE76_01460 [Cnuella takakiae]